MKHVWIEVSGLASLALVSAVAFTSARAADHSNLEEGIPITIEDAYPLGQGAIEAQYYFRYDRTSQGHDRYWTAPRLEYGIIRNAQIDVELPYRFGDAEGTDQGDFRAAGLYNFNTEGLWLPAMSVAGGVIVPFGSDAGGTETELKFIATKSLGNFGGSGYSAFSYVPRQVSFNFAWFHNYDPLGGASPEREDRYLIGIAYAQPITNDLVLALDVFREEEREKGEVTNMAQIAGRYILNPQTVVSASAGFGFDNSADDFRAVVGLQRTLSFPWSW